VRSVHAVPVRCGFRPGSAADGHGTPASFKARVIRAALCPASRWLNIHMTTSAVAGSGSRRCARLPHAAWALFGCGPASASRYPYGTPYTDLGAGFYASRETPQARQDYLIRQLRKLNPRCVITVTPAETA